MEPDKTVEICCQLTTPELQNRRATVLAILKQKVTESKELVDGYAFAFKGDNKVIDEIMEFIKSERQCCPFFTFSLSIKDEKSLAWLSITGPGGAKEFIQSETGLTLV